MPRNAKGMQSKVRGMPRNAGEKCGMQSGLWRITKFTKTRPPPEWLQKALQLQPLHRGNHCKGGRGGAMHVCHDTKSALREHSAAFRARPCVLSNTALSTFHMHSPTLFDVLRSNACLRHFTYAPTILPKLPAHPANPPYHPLAISPTHPTTTMPRTHHPPRHRTHPAQPASTHCGSDARLLRPCPLLRVR